MPAMERPPADPSKLLAQWMEWERGEESPGRVMSNLKTTGLREVLEHLTAEQEARATPVVGEVLEQVLAEHEGQPADG
jgi:hypothetical protein